MKPAPIPPNLTRPLSADERLFLKIGSEGAFRLHGPVQFATARRLVKMGLGELSGNMFAANEAGRVISSD